MKIINLEQRSDEWFEYRYGRPSASKFNKIVTSTGQKSKTWQEYAIKCASEAVAGKTEESYQSKDMQRGIELEPEARNVYEFIMGFESGECGLVSNDAETIVCSPDGLYPNVGLEIKCPIGTTHAKYLLKGVLPTDYKHQVYGCLWLCDELEYWDFFSYHPDFKNLLVRTTREDDGYKTYSEALEKYMPEFLKDVSEIIEKIK